MVEQDKYEHSIGVLKLASKMSEQYYNKPLLLSYSGGKDSDVLLQLAIESGINFEVQNSHTTVDAPPTVYHIREVFKKLEEQGISCKVRMSSRFKGRARTGVLALPEVQDQLHQGIFPNGQDQLHQGIFPNGQDQLHQGLNYDRHRGRCVSLVDARPTVLRTDRVRGVERHSKR